MERLPLRDMEEPLSRWLRKCPCCDRVSDSGYWVKNPKYDYVCENCATDFEWLWPCENCGELECKEPYTLCEQCKAYEEGGELWT